MEEKCPVVREYNKKNKEEDPVIGDCDLEKAFKQKDEILKKTLNELGLDKLEKVNE